MGLRCVSEGVHELGQHTLSYKTRTHYTKLPDITEKAHIPKNDAIVINTPKIVLTMAGASRLFAVFCCLNCSVIRKVTQKIECIALLTSLCGLD